MPPLTTLILVTVLRVIDGDTLSIQAANCHVPLLCQTTLRVAHIDAPELHSTCTKERDAGRLALNRVKQLVPPGTVLTLTDPKKDRYGRILADVPLIRETLIAEGLAVLYEGEKKPSKPCN